MKPTHELSIRPKTDYYFQPVEEPRAGSFQKKPCRKSSFRDLSRDYLRRETPRDFVVELLFFVLIVAISAWPLLSLADAMTALTR